MSKSEASKSETAKAEKKLDDRVLHLEREKSIGSLVLKGGKVPLRTKGEKLFKIVRDLIATNFGVTLMTNDVKRVHRLTAKQCSPILIQFNSSHDQSMFYKLTDPKLKTKMKSLDLSLSKYQCSHDSKIRFICELLVKYDVLNTSFINKDGLTAVKIKKEGAVIPITTQAQLLTLLDKHEKMSTINDIFAGKIVKGPPKPDAMEVEETLNI